MTDLENKTYTEIKVGDHASIKRVLTDRDVKLFAALSGDVNPAHLDAEYARSSSFQDIIGHGMWGAALISAVLGAQLPGPGAIYLSQELEFLKPVRLGDEITVSVVVAEKRERNRIALDCECRNQKGETVLVGQAVVLAPETKVKRPLTKPPRAFLHETGSRLEALIEEARDGAAIRTGVVHPVNDITLEG
ncbi:MAG: MaoC/PaaZ C-terminal domain-containing protein, partial [Pseudomonadota bacterium]